MAVVVIIAALLTAFASASAVNRQSGACLKGTTMINEVFDPHQCHPYAGYGRMSNDSQNPHSPERQYGSLDEVLKRLKLPWVLIKNYRDDALSGRLVGKRPGFQAMLSDIRTGIIEVDLILVDTYERVGRAEEIPSILRELRVKHGVLLLAANKNFAAPTGAEGMLLAAVEQFRATEDNRTKAHQVVSGKNLKARNGFWPGGPIPIGLKLEAVFGTRKGIEVLDGHKLVPDPTTAWIVQKLFQKADESKWGSTRLARWLNDDAGIPDEYKPFYSDSVAYILNNHIYQGELIWQRNATDIIADTRRVVRNPADVVKTYSEFCEPLVSPALWGRVHALRQERSKKIKLARAEKKTANAKKIKPLAPGLVLKHPLSGLVRCAHCGSAMRPMTSGAKSKAGATYCYYTCPRAHVHACPNNIYVREEPLRTAVLSAFRDRLFTSSLGEGQMPDWYAPLIEDVQRELNEIHGGDRDERPALRVRRAWRAAP
jgi:site-specific DNA recombinase